MRCGGAGCFRTMNDYDIPRDKDNPWRDAELLRRLYHDERLNQHEIADLLDISQTTVGRWMKRHGIEARDNVESQISDERLVDEEWLREHYTDKRLTTYDIAEIIGCSPTAVHRAIHRAGIEPHSQAIHKETIHPTFDINSNGYVRVTSHNYVDGDLESSDHVGVHQLLAIAEGADPYKVFSGGEYHVHHETDVPWDNRPGVIELISRKEHKSHHANIYWGNKDIPEF